MKIFKRIFLRTFVLGTLYSILGTACASAQEYIFFYGNGCSHCAKVENFFEENIEIQNYSLSQKEIYFDEQNREEFMGYVDALGLDSNKVGVPFLVIVNNGGTYQYRMGDSPIINYFTNLREEKEPELDSSVSNNENIQESDFNMEDAEIIYEDEINISEEGTYDEIISGIENGDDESVVHINSNHNTNGHNDLISENDSEYLIFYGNGCPHCQKLMNYIKKNNLNANYDIDTLEIYFNYTNLDKLFAYLEKLGLETHTVGVPFLIINNDYECAYLNGYQAIIEFFDTKINERELPKLCEDESQTLLTGDETKRNVGLTQRLSFFGIMLPAALADSINPCAFAVILLLLSSILVKSDNRKKALWAGILFTLAVFISYFAMGLGLFSALATATNTFVLKIIVGVFGILVGLANLKDFFRYGKGFVMEVPFAWRPKMQKIMSKIASPIGAFIIGFLISLFLLPCTSGPYFTILGYLAAESKNLHFWGYLYLIVYNIIFILPMIAITLLVGSGLKSAEELAALKNKHKKVIHLIVGLLMLGLGAYVLLTM